jgi:hypothetical protein
MQEEIFRNILDILRNDILCSYRSILQVYGETWLPINEIKGFQTRQLKAAIEYETFSIVFAQLLQTWIKRITDTIAYVEIKLY